jgi:hypothetical protein
MDEVVALFPVPFLRAPATLPRSLVNALVESFSGMAVQGNNSSQHLSHTATLRPGDSPLLAEATAFIVPKLADFGLLMLGERLPWHLKEMWVNVLDTGGRQAMHNHANSFISGVLYLTPSDASACTVFMKSPGGSDFAFRNDHAGVSASQFNADKWISPEPAPGDLVLFPSYLMHAVPPNAGGRRITLAFNAIPARIESWGYTLNFSA